MKFKNTTGRDFVYPVHEEAFLNTPPRHVTIPKGVVVDVDESFGVRAKFTRVVETPVDVLPEPMKEVSVSRKKKREDE